MFTVSIRLSPLESEELDDEKLITRMAYVDFDGEKALDNYMKALKLGYTKSISEIYETAGIKFDFSVKYVKELADFVKTQLTKLDDELS